MNKPTRAPGPTGKPFNRPTCPLPDWAGGLFHPPGAFTHKHSEAIAADERWYADSPPYWPNMPLSVATYKKRLALAARLQHANFRDVPGASGLALILAGCTPGSRCQSHACPECCRAQQRCVVAATHRQFKKSDAGYSDWSITLIMPEGQTRFDSFGQVDFGAIMALPLAALSACPSVKFAILGFDISANDDREKFKHGRLTFGPKVYAQVHLHGLVRASSKDEIKACLSNLFTRSANIFRPLTVLPFDGSARGISYIIKPDGYRHVPYLNANGEWATPRTSPALKPREHVFYALQMHALGLSGRIGLVGLHPVVRGANRRITFRRVARGRPNM